MARAARLSSWKANPAARSSWVAARSWAVAAGGTSSICSSMLSTVPRAASTCDANIRRQARARPRLTCESEAPVRFWRVLHRQRMSGADFSDGRLRRKGEPGPTPSTGTPHGVCSFELNESALAPPGREQLGPWCLLYQRLRTGLMLDRQQRFAAFAARSRQCFFVITLGNATFRHDIIPLGFLVTARWRTPHSRRCLVPKLWSKSSDRRSALVCAVIPRYGARYGARFWLCSSEGSGPV